MQKQTKKNKMKSVRKSPQSEIFNRYLGFGLIRTPPYNNKNQPIGLAQNQCAQTFRQFGKLSKFQTSIHTYTPDWIGCLCRHIFWPELSSYSTAKLDSRKKPQVVLRVSDHYPEAIEFFSLRVTHTSRRYSSDQRLGLFTRRFESQLILELFDSSATTTRTVWCVYLSSTQM